MTLKLSKKIKYGKTIKLSIPHIKVRGPVTTFLKGLRIEGVMDEKSYI